MFGLRPRYATESWKDYLWDHVSWCLGRRAITFWWQRRTRGFDDSDLWSLDYTILRFTLPRLKALREMVHGFPGEFLYADETEQAVWAYEALPSEAQERISNEAFQRWKDTIGEMIESIELWLEHDGNFENDEQEKRFQKGWVLFQKYFFALWD